IEDTTAPNAPTISTVHDDISPVIADLSSGDRSNDPNLTVTMGRTDTNTSAAWTVHMYNGTSTGSPVGSAHVLTAAEITAGSFSMQTGTLTDGTTYNLTAPITDGAYTLSLHDALPILIEDTTAPNAPTISTVHDDISPVIADLSSGDRSNDPNLTV